MKMKNKTSLMLLRKSVGFTPATIAIDYSASHFYACATSFLSTYILVPALSWLLVHLLQNNLIVFNQFLWHKNILIGVLTTLADK